MLISYVHSFQRLLRCLRKRLWALWDSAWYTSRETSFIRGTDVPSWAWGSLARTRRNKVFERPHILWHLCYSSVPCSVFGKRSKVEEKPVCAQQHRSSHSLKIVFSSNTSVWQRLKHIRILRIFVMTRKFSHRNLFFFISQENPWERCFFFFFEALLLWVSPASFSSLLQGQPYSMWHFDQTAQTPYIHIWCCLLHCVCSISRPH